MSLHSEPDAGMLIEAWLQRPALLSQVMIAEQALRDITRCDYRGNEPPEQMIARLALADLEREKHTSGVRDDN